MKKIITKLYHLLILHCWNIGFVEYDDFKDILSTDKLNVKWMKHNYKDRWFADPFFLNINEYEYDLLVEEYCDDTNLGRISRLHVDRNSLELKKIEVILELSTHLSFPAILQHEGKIYIYPENSVDNRLLFYEFNPFDNSLQPTAFVLNFPLTDAVVCPIFDKYYIFSTQLPYHNGSELDVYSAMSWNSPYKLDYKILFSDFVARNAGTCFKYNGKLVRPAQDCNGAYGKGIVLQELYYRNNEITFQELKRYYPHSWRYNLGMHTFNVMSNTIVLDGRGYRRPFWGHILEFIRHFTHI